MSKPRLVIICGPTGVGKTSAGIGACRHFGGEIVSADSMQVYRKMDIGTAKPTAEEQRAARHHLIDIVDPDEPFDAARFSEMARSVVNELHATDTVPFVVGGTGLYIKSLLYGIFQAESPPDEVRQRIKAEAEQHGSAALHNRLQQLDPATAGRLHPNDTYRIIRALEMIETTGKSISSHHAHHGFNEMPYEALKIGLEMGREVLYDRINVRVDRMISEGLQQEVEGLLGRGYSAELKSMQSIGYRHMVDYLQGRLDWEEAVRTLKRDTRRFAKRQFTWFKADPEIIWTEPDRVEELYPKIEAFLKIV